MLSDALPVEALTQSFSPMQRVAPPHSARRQG